VDWRAAGVVRGMGLELPEAFGLWMPIADVAKAEPGEVPENYQETEDGQHQEHRGEKQACEHPERGFEVAKVRCDLATDGSMCVGERHYIFNALDWL